MPATVMSSPSEPASPPPSPLGGVLVPTVPLAHARLLMHVVSQRGADTAELLKEAGLEASLLARDEGEVYATEYAALLRAAMKLTQDPCLGFEIGMNMPPTMHGTLGHALLAAGNLADAIDIAVTYWRLTGRFMEVTMHRSDTEVRLVITERLPLGPLQRFAYESVMGGWVHAARHLLGRFTGRMGSKLRFTFPYDPAFARYAERLPDVEFGCPANEIIIPIQHLDTSLPMGHPEAARQARAACDAALARMSEQSSLLHQVANSLALTAEGYPTMAQVARRLGITPRTLARHLDRHGVTFRQVLDERRHQEACTMLVTSPQPVEDIASRLGYNDPANFTRAFRRWAGCTPTQYRQRHAASAR
ncbi:MAG: AraC family transcriptional regulator [Aquabacterium sp.]